MNGKLKCKVAAVNEVSQLCNGKVSERVFIEYKGTLSKEIPKLIYFKTNFSIILAEGIHF